MNARYPDFTPSVMKLVELGLPALCAVLDLLDAPDLMTRRRAERVLEGVIMRRHGWMRGKGYPNDRDGQKLTRDLLAANGDYYADAPSEMRRAAIEKWRALARAPTRMQDHLLVLALWPRQWRYC